MKPGDRRSRWDQMCILDMVLFGGIGVVALLGIEGVAGLSVAGGCALMVALAVRDYRRGWCIRYDLPTHGRRAIERGDPVAIAAWEATKRKALEKSYD